MDDMNFNDEFTEERTPAANGGSPSKKGDSAGGGQERAKRRNRNILLAVAAVVVAAVFFTIGWLAQFYSIDSRARTLLWLIDTVDDNYYREISDEEWDGIYSELYGNILPDRFCSYFTPEEYEQLLKESEGSNRDTGLSAIDVGSELRVYRVVGNSPAALAGIVSGMVIYRFGGSEETLQTGDRNALYDLAGKTGGTLYMECGFPDGDKKIFAVQSADYLASYCFYQDSGTSYEFRGDELLVLTDTGSPLDGLDGKTAYIRLAQFDGNADEEFVQLLDLMKKRGRENLVLDLRGNGGGYLATFQSIASHMLRNADTSKPLVATASFRSSSRSYYADGNDFSSYFSADARITVLADENTASASECLIGALVDYGTVNYSDIYLRKTEGVTAHSYGKGVMQSAFVAANGSMLRLTTARINWPSGKSIHEVGVTEEDGAVGVIAPLLPYERDGMLAEVLARIS